SVEPRGLTMRDASQAAMIERRPGLLAQVVSTKQWRSYGARSTSGCPMPQLHAVLGIYPRRCGNGSGAQIHIAAGPLRHLLPRQTSGRNRENSSLGHTTTALALVATACMCRAVTAGSRCR